MPKLIDYWKSEIDRQPMIAVVLLIWCVTAGFNAVMGYDTGGGWHGGIKSWLYAGCFVGIAAIGAYGWAQQAQERGAIRFVLVLFGLLQLAFGQVAGWQSLGLTLSKGATLLEDQASTRKSATSALDDARAELAKIGTTRAIGAIKADETLECRRTSSQYKDGVGPACTRLRGELASAERAEKLRELIPTLTGNVGTAPKVSNPNALYEVPVALANGIQAWWTGKKPEITPDDARFWWLVFLVVTLELIGTFGFWVFGIHGSDPEDDGGSRKPHGGNDDRGRGFLDGLDDGLALAGAGSSVSHHKPLRRMVLRPRLPTPPAWPPARPLDAQHVLPQIGGQPANGGASAHGAPITINFPSVPQIGAISPQAADGIRAAAVDAPLPSSAGEMPARAPQHDVGAIEDSPPVDRSGAGAIIDNLLAFKAACCVDVSGGHITDENMYDRYVAWRGPDAIAPATFDALFPDIAKLRSMIVNGRRHYVDVTLRAPSLVAIAG